MRPYSIFLVFIFTAGAVLAGLNNTIWNNAILGWAGLFSWGIEVCIFSFAIALKVRNSELRATRESMHAFGQLSKIVYPHQISQIKQGNVLETTMPQDYSEGCVICFDIAGSSKIRHALAKDFMRQVFSRCYEVPMKTIMAFCWKPTAIGSRNLGMDSYVP